MAPASPDCCSRSIARITAARRRALRATRCATRSATASVQFAPTSEGRPSASRKSRERRRRIGRSPGFTFTTTTSSDIAKTAQTLVARRARDHGRQQGLPAHKAAPALIDPRPRLRLARHRHTRVAPRRPASTSRYSKTGRESASPASRRSHFAWATSYARICHRLGSDRTPTTGAMSWRWRTRCRGRDQISSRRCFGWRSGDRRAQPPRAVPLRTAPGRSARRPGARLTQQAHGRRFPSPSIGRRLRFSPPTALGI